MNDFGQRLLLMCFGYLVTIAIETIVLVAALSKRHSLGTRIFAGVWLTACTYPIVWLVLPVLIPPHLYEILYLAVAETFAPVAECLLFWWVIERQLAMPAASAIIDDAEPAQPPIPLEPISRQDLIRDMFVIVIANLASFGFGLLLDYVGMWDIVVAVINGKKQL
jgi:hypothetical protein